MKVFIPYYLNKPMLVLWWETDEMLVAALLFTFISIVDGIAPIFIAVALFMIYRRVRHKFGRGFINHLPYMLGFKSFEGFPHAFVTKWEE